MSTAEKIQVAAVLVAAVTFVGREINAARLERKRSQPVVVAHEQHDRTFDRARGGWTITARLRNDGGGTGFNVRFGVELRGVRFPYRYDDDAPPDGTRFAVVPVGQHVSDCTWAIESGGIWEVAALRQDGQMSASRVYWCRYENASGATWETRNPPERGNLVIKRVRFPRVGEWQQRWRRRRARKAFEAAIQNTIAARPPDAEQPPPTDAEQPSA